MGRIAWELQVLARIMGVAGIAGILFAIAGLVVYQFGVVPAREEIAAEAVQLARLQLRARQAAQGAPGPRTTSERLGAFYGFFPRLDELPDWLNRIYDAAAAQAIALDKGEYALSRERDGKLLRYQLTLPVRASYPRIKGFLERVLADVPAAALDSVAFQRDSIAAGQVDAQLRLTLILGGP